jgi:general secretion pathway protein D
LLLAMAIAPAARGERPMRPPPRRAVPASADALPVVAGPAVVESDGERYITMDFQDVDIAVLVKFIGEITGKNSSWTSASRARSRSSRRPASRPDEAYQVFQAVLQVKGFTTVPSGAAVRIIPTKDAKATSLRTLERGGTRRARSTSRGSCRSAGRRRRLIGVLQPMVSPDGLVTAYPQTNALIIVDSAANVERLAKLVAELDVASSRRQTAMLHAQLRRRRRARRDDPAGARGPAAPGRPRRAPGKPAPSARS